jgi:hypothetical protein
MNGEGEAVAWVIPLLALPSSFLSAVHTHKKAVHVRVFFFFCTVTGVKEAS